MVVLSACFGKQRDIYIIYLLAAWFAARVTLNLVNSGNANLFTKLVTTVFGLLIVYFGIVQQAFTDWTTAGTAYALSQVEEPSGRFDSFIAFFAGEGEPTYSLIGDPFITSVSYTHLTLPTMDSV